MSARDRILSRLKRSLGEGGAPEKREKAVRRRLGNLRQRAPSPAQAKSAPAERIALFTERAEQGGSTVSRIANSTDLPGALAEELRRRNLGPSIRMGADPLLAGLGWSGLETSTGPGRIDEPATISVAPMAAAESGIVALLSGPENPVTLTFLGETHFIVLRAEAIEAGLDDIWAAIRRSGRDPRTVNLVTGPSRSADIGQRLQMGAHGPVAVHVFILGDEPAQK